MDNADWRLLWRVRGLALDRLLPRCGGDPALELSALRGSVPRSVVVPESGRVHLSLDDAECVYQCALYIMDYVARSLPMQITVTDVKKHVPQSVSQLAVRVPGEPGATLFLGSFDFGP